ncbi:putative MATE family efflux protein [Hasllibacter halocynthiae]|uniref:Putative MATE family efflux protein n=1 Tax=Hasllibacter halocynthiae TaxID=595589 RepID=A0A2T0X9J1_9RHOB|nr:MATE family efflux transporter [Hasllibacter halocynthiae]PRY95534.1 putative MATE family efflux protein [Hasllibacter halocynthiae]
MAVTRDLTEGPVWRALAAVSAPMTLGILAVFSVGIVDAIFLGMIGRTELAAVGFIYPVTVAVTSLSVGLSAGANAALSQSLGRKDEVAATRRKGIHATLLATVLSLIVGAAFFLLDAPLFRLLGASGEVLDAVVLYTPIWSLSFPFLVSMMVVNAIFRAHGDGTTAAGVMVLSAVVNVALDPVLIFGWGPIPGLGMAGAAWATLAGRVAALALALGIAWRRGLLDTCRSPLKDFGASAREIAGVGGPAAFSNAINPAGLAMVTAAVATVGDAAVAGFGAASRVQSLILVPLFALSAGIGPVVGQNWGAGKQDRARTALKQSWLFCAGFGLLAATVVTVFAHPIADLLAAGEESRLYAILYLRVISWSLFGYGVLVVANAAMNARSKARWSMMLGILRTFGLFLPLAWMGVWAFGYPGILAAAVVANVTIVWAAAVAARATGLLRTDAAPIRVPAERALAVLPKPAS